MDFFKSKIAGVRVGLILEQLWDIVRIVGGIWIVAAAVTALLMFLFGTKHGGIAAIAITFVGWVLFAAYKVAESEQQVQQLEEEQRQREKRREEQRREERLRQKKRSPSKERGA